MNNSEFDTNILKLIAAQLTFSNSLLAAREMFGKSYFALGQQEKIAVDQAAFGNVAANFQNITPAIFSGPSLGTIAGFQGQATEKK
jgi:hypothetical protein